MGVFMEHIRRTVLVVAASVLTSCVTAYVEPEGANSASITFVNDADRIVGLQGFKVAGDCSGGKFNFNKTADLGTGERLTIKVRAGEPFSFFFLYNRISSPKIDYARQPVTFVPRSGNRYQSEIVVRGNRYDVTVEQLAGETHVPEPSARLRTWRTPMTESGSFCD
jgi:hypothetical protein